MFAVLAVSLLTTFSPSSFGGERGFLAIIKPKQVLSVPAQRDGMLTDISIKRGDLVKKGDVIAIFDCTKDEEHFKELKKIVNYSEKWLEKYQRLAKQKLVKQEIIDEKLISLARDVAGYKRAQKNLSFCKVFASINGVVAARYADEGQFVSNRDNLFEIVSHDKVIESLIDESVVAYSNDYTLSFYHKGENRDCGLHLEGSVPHAVPGARAIATFTTSQCQLPDNGIGRVFIK